MTREEYIDNLKSFAAYFKDEIEHSGFGDARFDEEQAKKDIETFEAAIKALSQINDIKAIINNPMHLQEDVLRYQMICEVVKE